MRAALGIAIVIGHALMFVALASQCSGDELVVDIASGSASTDRARVDDDTPPGPGMHHRRWTVDYRGGFERSVGSTRLEGPFQDPAAHACTGRVIVGQKLLDDGIAGAIGAQLDASLQGQGVFPIGDFQHVDHLALRWARIENQPSDASMVGTAPHGYVRLAATIAFARVDVPVVVALIPELANGVLRFRIESRAELDFGNRFLQWVSDKLGGNKLATRLARDQIDDALVTTLAPPPPFELPGGQMIRFTYCDEPPEIADGAWAAMPFSVEITSMGEHAVLPPRLGPGPRPTPSRTTALALDLDLDALNALLYELWRTGYLDKQLARVGLDRRFNSDPIVTEYLSIRLSPVRLALPPFVSAGPRGLRLATDARVSIKDGTSSTMGHVWGGVDFAFDRVSGTSLPITASLGALELSCEATPATLVPCYGDLVAALRDRGDELQGALTTAFVGLLGDIFVDRRLGAAGMPMDLVIKSATPSVVTRGTNGTLHFELDATLSK